MTGTSRSTGRPMLRAAVRALESIDRTELDRHESQAILDDHVDHVRTIWDAATRSTAALVRGLPDVRRDLWKVARNSRQPEHYGSSRSVRCHHRDWCGDSPPRRTPGLRDPRRNGRGDLGWDDNDFELKSRTVGAAPKAHQVDGRCPFHRDPRIATLRQARFAEVELPQRIESVHGRGCRSRDTQHDSMSVGSNEASWNRGSEAAVRNDGT